MTTSEILRIGTATGLKQVTLTTGIGLLTFPRKPRISHQDFRSPVTMGEQISAHQQRLVKTLREVR